MHESHVMKTMPHDAMLVAPSFDFGRGRGRGDPHTWEPTVAWMRMLRWLHHLGPEWLEGGTSPRTALVLQ